MRVIVRPFWVASARQRINNRSKSTSLGSSFFSGWRSIPGTMPATSQLAWLISMTEMIVLSCSRGVRDLLKSSSCCAMGRSIALLPATMVTSRHRLPHSISGEVHHPPNRPQKGGHLTGDRRHRHRRPLAGRDEPPIAGAQPNLGLPGDLANRFGQALQSDADRFGDPRRVSMVLSGLAPPPLADESAVWYRPASHGGGGRRCGAWNAGRKP